MADYDYDWETTTWNISIIDWLNISFVTGDNGKARVSSVFVENRRFESVFIPVLYSLALLVGLLGNGLLLGVLGLRSHNWSVTDTFILHLGVADTLLLVTLPFWATQATPAGWVFGTPFCKVAGALFTVGSGLNRMRICIYTYIFK